MSIEYMILAPFNIVLNQMILSHIQIYIQNFRTIQNFPILMWHCSHQSEHIPSGGSQVSLSTCKVPVSCLPQDKNQNCKILTLLLACLLIFVKCYVKSSVLA